MLILEIVRDLMQQPVINSKFGYVTELEIEVMLVVVMGGDLDLLLMVSNHKFEILLLLISI